MASHLSKSQLITVIETIQTSFLPPFLSWSYMICFIHFCFCFFYNFQQKHASYVLFLTPNNDGRNPIFWPFLSFNQYEKLGGRQRQRPGLIDFPLHLGQGRCVSPAANGSGANN